MSCNKLINLLFLLVKLLEEATNSLLYLEKQLGKVK